MPSLSLNRRDRPRAVLEHVRVAVLGQLRRLQHIGASNKALLVHKRSVAPLTHQGDKQFWGSGYGIFPVLSQRGNMKRIKTAVRRRLPALLSINIAPGFDDVVIS